MAESIWAPDTEHAPSIARINDYWREGSHHTDADREMATQIAACAPHMPYLVRELRHFLGRMVRYLTEQGVRQFIDLGSGIPAVNAVHEVAQGIDPECHVVYVDNDRSIVDTADELLAGNDRVAMVHADLMRPDQVLNAQAVRDLIDFSRPVGVLMVETLQDIPDTEQPAAAVARYVDAVCSGSYVGFSHYGPDDEQLVTGLNLFSRMFGAPPMVTLRDSAELEAFFTGLELVEPGIVPMPRWRPDPGHDLGQNPDSVAVHVGLGRKP